LPHSATAKGSRGLRSPWLVCCGRPYERERLTGHVCRLLS
jgi:hypothetical protein